MTRYYLRWTRGDGETYQVNHADVMPMWELYHGLCKGSNIEVELVKAVAAKSHGLHCTWNETPIAHWIGGGGA